MKRNEEITFFRASQSRGTLHLYTGHASFSPSLGIMYGVSGEETPSQILLSHKEQNWGGLVSTRFPHCSFSSPYPLSTDGLEVFCMNGRDDGNGGFLWALFSRFGGIPGKVTPAMEGDWRNQVPVSGNILDGKPGKHRNWEIGPVNACLDCLEASNMRSSSVGCGATGTNHTMHGPSYPKKGVKMDAP